MLLFIFFYLNSIIIDYDYDIKKKQNFLLSGGNLLLLFMAPQRIEIKTSELPASFGRKKTHMVLRLLEKLSLGQN